MVHIIIEENIYPLTGRVVMIGDKNNLLGDYRLLTRVLCDHFGADSLIKATTDCAHDDISNVEIVIKG